MSYTRVGIVGVGAVGATAGYTMALQNICNEIVLFDISSGVAKGKAIDIAQASYYCTNSTNVISVNEISDMKDCDIVVITAGVPRKKDMTRADLLMINAKIIKDVTLKIKKASPNTIIICVSNPLDVMTYVISRLTNWESNRIIGMAGALDGARMAYQINQKTNISMQQTGSLVIGDHGEKMIPLPQQTSINDISLKDILSSKDMEDIIDKTKTGGAQIVSHLGTSGYYAPGRAIAYMVENILNDTKKIVPSCVLLQGQYGYKDIAIGVPVVLGINGVESIIEIDLDQNTKAKFANSIKSIQESIDILEENKFFEGL
jgi:malate dehydrogenase